MNRKPAVIIVISVGLLGIIFWRVFPFSTSQSSVPSPTPVQHPVSKDTLTADEEGEILTASTTMVTSNTEEGYTYSLEIKKRVENYVRVDVTPVEGEMIDPAQVILEKKDGVWTAITFGTSFPELYEKVPELFQ